MTEDLKKYHLLTHSLCDSLKARDASASKKTRPQFSKSMLGIESAWNYMGFFHADLIWSINFENCGRVFSFEHHISAFEKMKFESTSGPITRTKIIATPMCHTYSESLGRALSDGPTLDESYQFKILSNMRFNLPCFPCF